MPTNKRVVGIDEGLTQTRSNIVEWFIIYKLIADTYSKHAVFTERSDILKEVAGDIAYLYSISQYDRDPVDSKAVCIGRISGEEFCVDPHQSILFHN